MREARINRSVMDLSFSEFWLLQRNPPAGRRAERRACKLCANLRKALAVLGFSFSFCLQPKRFGVTGWVQLQGSVCSHQHLPSLCCYWGVKVWTPAKCTLTNMLLEGDTIGDGCRIPLLVETNMVAPVINAGLPRSSQRHLQPQLKLPPLVFCALNHKYHDCFAYLRSSTESCSCWAISLRDTTKFIIVTLRLFHKFIISLLFPQREAVETGPAETPCLC